MKNRVLLINPPQTLYKHSQGFNVCFPLGLLQIAAVVKNDCNLSIYDTLVSDFVIHKTKDSTIFGASDKDILRKVKRFKPDIVGISAPFTCQRENALRVAKIVKSYNRRTLVVLGGPDASVAGQTIMSTNNSVDICVQGEGEYTFQKIIRQYHNATLLKPDTIPGIWYRNKNKNMYSGPNEPIMNLDKLPFPEYNLIQFNTYLHHPYIYKNRSPIAKNSISVITSRGCPHNCIFCSIHLHMGRAYRFHSHEYVFKHIQMLVQKYHIKNIHFEDDNLTLNRNRFEKLLDNLIQNNIPIRWDTPNGVRADTLSLPLLKKMKQSGCVSLTIAIESGSQRVLDKIVDKHLNLHQAEKVARWCKDIHLPLQAFYVIGFPGEKKFEIKKTLDYAIYVCQKYGVVPSVFIATPLYGTRLYDIVTAKNYLTQPLTEALLATGTQLHGNHLIKTEDFSTKDLDIFIKEYETKVRFILWSNYHNRFNLVSNILKYLIMHYVYPSNNVFLMRCTYHVVYIDMVMSTVVLKLYGLLKRQP